MRRSSLEQPLPREGFWQLSFPGWILSSLDVHPLPDSLNSQGSASFVVSVDVEIHLHAIAPEIAGYPSDAVQFGVPGFHDPVPLLARLLFDIGSVGAMQTGPFPCQGKCIIDTV